MIGLQRFNLISRGISLMTRRERWQAVAIIMLMVVTGLLESSVVALVVPLVYVIIDPSRFGESGIGTKISAFLGQPIGALFPWIAIILMLLLIASYVINMLAIYFSARHSASCRDRMAAELLRLITSAPYLWLLKQPIAVLKRHIHEDVRAWRNDFVQALLQVVHGIIQIIAPSVVAIAIATAAGFAALAVVAVFCAIIVVIFRKKIRVVSAKAKAINDRMMRGLLQILQGIREIKVSGRAEYFTGIFNRHHSLHSKLGVAARMYSAAPVNTITLLGQVGFVATAMLLWWRGGSGAEIAAQLALIGVVVSRVVPAANNISNQITVIYRTAPFVESLVGFRNSLLKMERRDERASGKPLPTSWRTLSMSGVSFRYPGTTEASLSEISLSLQRGRFYGFVGRSGAGKSTLVNLLLGLVEPTEGQVMVDDMPLNEISTADWHSRFGYVPQDAFILDASLRENVAFGEPVDDARIMEALDRAQLGPVVSVLSNGLDTELGERGRRFSGGQAQRVAIARALYKGCDVMLLDEATSALDSISESEIHESLEPLRGHVMALVIAHRVSTLRRCDRIFVLEQGRIVDSGSYQELLGRSELFRALAAQSEQPVQMSA
jgi:ABC-type multidrug transport system fused ATPase/permease subunit